MIEKCLYSYSQSVIFIKKNPRIIFWLSLLCLFISIYSNLNNNQLFAQAKDIKFEHLTVDQGLSQNFITCIFQDSEGFMWLGTQDGLNKYDGYNITIFNYNPLDTNSLSCNSIASIYQDKSGIIWIGTDRDLNKFDREKLAFKHFNIQSVQTIGEDSSGSLWFGTVNFGLFRFEKAANKFTNYTHVPLDPSSLSSDRIRSICFDSTGTIWLGTEGGGLARLIQTDSATTRFKNYRHDPLNPFSISSDSIFSIIEDKGILWIGTTGGGLDRFDPVKEEFVHYKHDPKQPNSLSCNHILSVHKDNNDKLWIGTKGGGLNYSDPETGKFVHNNYDPQQPNSLSSRTVWTIFQDRANTIWLGTPDGGVNKFTPAQIKFDLYQYDPYNPNSLKDNTIWSFCEDSSGTLWIGANTGLFRRNLSNSNHVKFEHYQYNFLGSATPKDHQIRAICEDHLGLLWLGTLSDGLFAINRTTGKVIHYQHDPENPNSLGNDNIYSIHEDRSGVIWIGTNGSGLEKFDREKNEFSQHHFILNVPYKTDTRWTTTIFESKIVQDDVLWLGTWSCGLNKFDKATEKFTCYLPDPAHPHSISNIIFSIGEDRQGNLWLGTNGGGLLNFNVQEEKFTRYTDKDGLPNNVIYGILVDNLDCLWLSTNKGISRFNPQTTTFTNYDITDGLQSNEFNLGAYYKSSRGEMFFGGPNGFNSFYPNNLVNRQPPAIALVNFKMYGKTVNFDKPLSQVETINLSYRENFFTFEFVALHFADSRRNQYAYKLEYFDNDWINSGDRREAIYTNVPPGNYMFRVKAANCDGVWNEQGIAMELRITPPYWQTWWFCLICCFLLCAIIVSIIKFRISQALKIEQARCAAREQIQKKLTQDFHDELGNRVSKILLISNLLKSKLQSPTPMISDFISNIIANANSLSAEMREYIWEIDPDKDTLYHLASHLKNFSDKLFELTTIGFQLKGLSPAIEPIKLPLEWRQHLIRIFKEGMNNILKHAEGCKNVTLEFKLDDKHLEIILTDDGKGFELNTITLGNGLKNMQERARQIDGSLTIASNIEDGTIIHFKGKLH